MFIRNNNYLWLPLLSEAGFFHLLSLLKDFSNSPETGIMSLPKKVSADGHFSSEVKARIRMLMEPSTWQSDALRAVSVTINTQKINIFLENENREVFTSILHWKFCRCSQEGMTLG